MFITSNHTGMPAAFSLPITNRKMTDRPTMTLTSMDKIYPITMKFEMRVPSGGCGSH